jgi:hypothetical protein
VGPLRLTATATSTTQFGAGSRWPPSCGFPSSSAPLRLTATEGQQALERLHWRLPSELKRFIVQSAQALPDDDKYDLHLRVFPELVKSPASGLPLRFVRAADMTEPQKALLRETGVRCNRCRRGIAAVLSSPFRATTGHCAHEGASGFHSAGATDGSSASTCLSNRLDTTRLATSHCTRHSGAPGVATTVASKAQRRR